MMRCEAPDDSDGSLTFLPHLAAVRPGLSLSKAAPRVLPRRKTPIALLLFLTECQPPPAAP
jgi:hypothetical protein